MGAGARPARMSWGYGAALTGEGALAAAAAVAALSWKHRVRCATTAAGTLASAFENGDTVDGVVVATGDRILIKNQAAAAENGIYAVNATGAPTRTNDFDSGAKAVGAVVHVVEGTRNADTIWACTTPAPITIDTTALTFARIGAGVEVPFDHGAMGATETFDLADGGWHRATFDANCVFTMQGWTVDQGAVMMIEFDGVGPFTATWDPDQVFAGNDQPPQDAGAWEATLVLYSSAGDSAIKSVWIGGAAFGTPAIVLGTAAADGVAETMLRTDATIVAFDATVPTTQAFGDAAATGSSAHASRRDHVHGMPAAPDTAHHILLADGHATPFAFTDLLQMDDGSNFMWSDA